MRPSRFGRRAKVRFRVPSGGDPVTAAVARVQRPLLPRWRAVRPRCVGTRAARVFAISSSTWRAGVLGAPRMGETVMAAVLHSTHRR